MTDTGREAGLEPVLVRSTLRWLGAAWSFRRVVLPLRTANPTGIALARTLGLEAHEASEHPDHACFLWTAPAARAPCVTP
ncbi:MAG: hypothetical protein GY898_16305 [Proteobacteria bacterium]|nr:hypothetical protein [Pseudomonadota bacterium]